MIQRACIDCGALSDEAHCPKHRGKKRNGSTRRWRKVRAAVLKRDNYRCHYCGRSATTVDHLRPISRGGTDDEENLVAACADCNSLKGDLTAAEFGSATERDGVTNLALGLGLLRRGGGQPLSRGRANPAHLAVKNSSEIGGAIRGR